MLVASNLCWSLATLYVHKSYVLSIIMHYFYHTLCTVNRSLLAMVYSELGIGYFNTIQAAKLINLTIMKGVTALPDLSHCRNFIKEQVLLLCHCLFFTIVIVKTNRRHQSSYVQEIKIMSELNNEYAQCMMAQSKRTEDILSKQIKKLSTDNSVLLKELDVMHSAMSDLHKRYDRARGIINQMKKVCSDRCS